jgi:hypothetical protein
MYTLYTGHAQSAEGIMNDVLTYVQFKLLIIKQNMANVRTRSNVL